MGSIASITEIQTKDRGGEDICFYFHDDTGVCEAKSYPWVGLTATGIIRAEDGIYLMMRFATAIVTVQFTNEAYLTKIADVMEAITYRQVLGIHARGCAKIQIEEIDKGGD